MEINNAQISMSAQSQQTSRISVREEVTVINQAQNTINETPLVNTTTSKHVTEPDSAVPLAVERSAEDELKLLLIAKIYERITGKHLLGHTSSTADKTLTLTENTQAQASLEISTAPETELQEVEIRQETLLEQHESVVFSASGSVHTADGETLAFALDMQLSRTTVQRLEINVSTAFRELKDPLVINLNQLAPELSSERISFDIDADGHEDLIPTLKHGSGYLALDKNNDGAVNNGSELFGALSGDGFADLQKHDDNQDGRIDNQDQVYKQLKIWVQEGPQNGQLISLEEQGISTLFLANSSTPFELYDTSGHETPLGIIRSTGIYLNEQGQAGTLQQIDLYT